jgi:site-specific recombinase XerD
VKSVYGAQSHQLRFQIQGDPMLITDALACYETQLEADGRSIHTRNQIRRHVRALATWTAQEGLSGQIEDLSHEHLARFLVSPGATTRPDGKGKTATSVNAMRSSLKTFFRYLHDAGLVDKNPARLIKRAMTAPPPPRSLTVDEEERLLAVLAQAEGVEGERDAVLFRMLLGTGLRLSSAVGLDIEDVDLDEGTMDVWMKGDRRERFFIPGAVRKELQAFIGDGRSGPLFASTSGRRITTRHAQRRFGILRDRAELSSSYSPHSLRHTLATRLLEKTHDIALVQAALGHRSITSTLVYARVSQRRLKEALS